MEKYFASEDGLKELSKKKEALNKTFVSDLDKSYIILINN
jgi:hypothetical protein